MIGAGIVGLATATALAARGVAVTVYERAAPGAGQSGGESRIFRHAHDDPRLVVLACRSRALWRAWEERFGIELLAADGVISLGPGAGERVARLRAAGVRARAVSAAEVAERLPLLAEPPGQAIAEGRLPLLAEPPGQAIAEARLPLLAEAPGPGPGPAMLDEDGGVIRTTAAIRALTEALGDALVIDEVLSVRTTASGTAEVRAAGGAAEHGGAVVCAGRGTGRLAAGVGLSLPVKHFGHVRTTFAVRGAAPARPACLLDGSGAFGEDSAYADPLPGNAHYAVGLDDFALRDAGSLLDPAAFAAASARTCAYVARALPGLSPEPAGTRHCWVTALPWSHDAIAAWQRGALTFVAGNNLFKHAPALGHELAGAACGELLPPALCPDARLGAPA